MFVKYLVSHQCASPSWVTGKWCRILCEWVETGRAGGSKPVLINLCPLAHFSFLQLQTWSFCCLCYCRQRWVSRQNTNNKPKSEHVWICLLAKHECLLQTEGQRELGLKKNGLCVCHLNTSLWSFPVDKYESVQQQLESCEGSLQNLQKQVSDLPHLCPN